MTLTGNNFFSFACTKINTLYGLLVYRTFRAVFTHENQDPSRVKFLVDGKGGAQEFAQHFKDDGVFYGLRKLELITCGEHSSRCCGIERVCLRLNLRQTCVDSWFNTMAWNQWIF